MFYLVAIAAVAVVSYVFWVEPLGVLGLLERLTPNLVYRIPTAQPFVALSFDDGPHPLFTPQVLDILRRHEAKATFFLIGERALAHPDLMARINAEGHQIGNHYSRNGSTLLHSNAKFLANLQQTENVLRLSGSAKLFRPPGGLAWPWQLQLAKVHGYTSVLGCAYPHDPIRPPVWYIRWLIKKNLRPGTIIILHDGISNAFRSLEALPAILDFARQRGLSAVSIGTLMKITSKLN